MKGLTKRLFLLVIVLVGTTASILPGSGRIRILDDAPVALQLPDLVGAYQAEDVRFCQAETCMRGWKLDELTPEGSCPACGSDVSEVALAEKRGLPEGTIIKRRQYVNLMGETFAVSIVLSGAEQKSLHRPQQCLPAQGHVIESSRTIDVPRSGRAPLPVKLLELHMTRNLGGASAYAYWFTGNGHETASNYQRMWWMSLDRLVRQEAHPWAYVAVSTSRDPTTSRHVERLTDFLSELYPALSPPQAENPKF